MNGGTTRTNDGSVQIGLAGMRTGVMKKMMFSELAVANKEKQVLMLHLGDLCRCFLVTCEQGCEVAVWSSLGMGKGGEAPPKVQLVFFVHE